MSSLFLINSSSLPALGGTVINVKERGRDYMSHCISVMYLEEIRGGREEREEGERERDKPRKTIHYYSLHLLQ